MSLTVNTNMQALKIQRNLNSSTDSMNQAMERMATGYKINSAKDDAAGWAVSTKMNTTISSSQIASGNVQIGSNLLDTAEGNLQVILSNVQRIRDLAEQAATGTYSAADRTAMQNEAQDLATEIDSIAGSTTFNGITLFGDTSATGAATVGIKLQVGTDSTDTLTLDKSIFASVKTTGIGLTGGSHAASIAAAFATATSANTFLGDCDTAISNLSARITQIGAQSNQLESASDALDVQQINLKAAVSTIKDADVASESAAYVQSQILQSASATLLVQANSAPQIALTLIQGQ